MIKHGFGLLKLFRVGVGQIYTEIHGYLFGMKETLSGMAQPGNGYARGRFANLVLRWKVVTSNEDLIHQPVAGNQGAVKLFTSWLVV